MAGLPLNFAIPGENISASYSYDDIAEGVGYVVYYATGFTGTGNTGAILRKEVMPIGSGNSSTITTQGSYQKVFDDDKDLTFNTTRNVKGKLLVNLSWSAGDGSCASWDAYFVVKFRKVSGGVETDIANVQTSTLSGSTNQTKYQSDQMYIEIPKTHFSKGDTLRITIEGWGQLVSSAVAASFSYNGDPTNASDANYEFTYLKFGIPYIIEA
jgi:hypothetical protein